MKTSILTSLALVLLQWTQNVYAWSTNTKLCCRNFPNVKNKQAKTSTSTFKHVCSFKTMNKRLRTNSHTALSAAQGYIKNDMMDLLHLVNKERMREGIPPVDFSEELEAVAYVHTLDMIKNHFFGHTGSDKSTLRERVESTGFQASVVGENLGKNLFSARDAMAYWMSQTDGFEQILNPHFTHFGAFEKSGKWTQVFAAFGTAPNVNNNDSKGGRSAGTKGGVPKSSSYARTRDPNVPNLNRGQPHNFNNGSRGSMESPFSHQEPIKYPSSQTRTMNNPSGGGGGTYSGSASRDRPNSGAYGGNTSGGFRSSASSSQYSNYSSGRSSYNSNGSSSNSNSNNERVRPNYDNLNLNNPNGGGPNTNGNGNNNNNGDMFGITELPTHYEITMSVPGINEQDIKVQLEQDGRILCLRGERKSWDDARLTEVEFERRFALGRDVDKGGIGATVRHGILFVKVARDEARRDVATYVPVTNIDENYDGQNRGSYSMDVDDYGPKDYRDNSSFGGGDRDYGREFGRDMGDGAPPGGPGPYGDERAYREYSPRDMGQGPPPPGSQGSYGDERRYREYGREEFGAQTDLNGNPVNGGGASYAGVQASPRTKKPTGYEASKSPGWSGWADNIPRARS